MISRLKKIARDIQDRDCAICYIDGEFIEGNTHSMCISSYIEDKCQQRLNNEYRRSAIFYDDYDQNCLELLSDNSQEDIKNIQENIKQLIFAHKKNDKIRGKEKDEIFIEQDSLYNIDINSAIDLFKLNYPQSNIYIDETNKKVADVKKLAWVYENDIGDNGDNVRKFAIVYIDGEIHTGYTHYECIQEYLNNHNINNDKDCELAFAYMHVDGNIYIGSDMMQNLNQSDLPMIAKLLKVKYPNSSILLDTVNGRSFDHEKIARLKKCADDNISNGIMWKDNIWDTYDDHLTEKQDSGLNKEWKFEEPVDNPEWIMQQD